MSGTKLHISSEMPESQNKTGYRNLTWDEVKPEFVKFDKLIPDDCENPMIYLNGDWSKALSTDGL